MRERFHDFFFCLSRCSHDGMPISGNSAFSGTVRNHLGLQDIHPLNVEPELWTQLHAAWAALRDELTVCGVDVAQRKGNHQEPALRVHLRAQDSSPALPDPIAKTVTNNDAKILLIKDGYSVSPTAPPDEHLDRFPLLMSGQTCSVAGGLQGTIAAIVIDEISGLPSLLTSAHVLQGPNEPLQTRIMQPVASDPSAQTNGVASRTRSVCDLDGLAGLALLTGERGWLPVVHTHYNPITSIRDVSLGDLLTRSTQCSPRTTATVEGIGFYRVGDARETRAFPGHWTRGFCLSPDGASGKDKSAPQSIGALWYDPDQDAAVGLQVTDGETIVACHMSLISRRLNIRMAGYDDLIDDVEAQNRKVWPVSNATPPLPALNAATTLSVASDVWPQVTAALSCISGLEDGGFTPNSTLENISWVAGQQIAAAISNSPFFSAMGIKLEAEDVASSNDFNDLLAVVIISIGDQGFTLVP